MKRGDICYIYQNELDKACLQHDTAYGSYKDLFKRTTFDKVPRDEAFKIANDPKRDGCERRLTSKFLSYLIRK